MNPEQAGNFGKGSGDDFYNVNRNNEAEGRIYAPSRNKNRNWAPRAPRDYEIPLPPTPPPPPPPMQNYMTTQRTFNPNTPHPSFAPLPHNNTNFPSYQNNPQSYNSSIPRSQVASNRHRPQRLKVPSVLTTSTPQISVMNHNIAPQPSLYYPPPNMSNYPPGMPDTNPNHGAILQQPGMQIANTSMGTPRLPQEMMMATYDNAWVVPPQNILNCPPGLEYLAEVDQLLIHQQLEILELITGFETKNKYMIRNTLGQRVYFAAEESGCCNRQCLGSSRAFDLNFYDHYGNIVMHMYRSLACDSCCFPCCLQSIEISSPPGNIIGTIHQNWSLCYPRFSVKDVNGNTILKIHGPFWTMSCCCNDVDFNIKTADGKMDIGKITKQWSGFVQETFTDTDNFSITFPMDMDITAKALLLAGVFLIDFMYYENNQ